VRTAASRHDVVRRPVAWRPCRRALTGLQATSLVYLFRFFDGYQPGGATAFYEPLAGGWRFGYNDYTTSVRNPQGNVQTYKGDTTIPARSTRRRARSRCPCRATRSKPWPGRRARSSARGGAGPDRLAHLRRRALVVLYQLPTSRIEQTFLTQADNSAAFDFLLKAAGSTPDTVVEPPAAAPDTAQPGGGGRLPATGGLGLPLLAVALVTGAAALLRRRRA
jgi:hypothetical protein